MSYVLIYQNSKHEIEAKVMENNYSKEIRDMEASGGSFLRVMKEETYKKEQSRKRKVSGWNQ